MFWLKIGGIRGVTIKLNFNKIELKENNVLIAESGVLLSRI